MVKANLKGVIEGKYNETNLKFNVNYMRKPMRIEADFVKRVNSKTYNSLYEIRIKYAQYKWNGNRVKWNVTEYGKYLNPSNNVDYYRSNDSDPYIDIDVDNDEYIKQIIYYCNKKFEDRKWKSYIAGI